jgi:hypothetical protein
MLLNENPFFILGASSRDTRQRIVELAEEKSLHLDQATCSRCSSELINPRQRLAAEVAWLPGCASSQAIDLLGKAINWRGGPLPALPSPLATANLHMTALAFGPVRGSQLGEVLLELAGTWERIDSLEVRALLNEDRAVAGFSPVENTAEVQTAVEARFAVCRTVLAGVLRRLPKPELTEVLTQALEKGTAKGSKHGPALLHSITDALSLDLQPELDSKKTTVESAMAKVLAAGSQGEHVALDTALGRLEGAIRHWDWFAQPLQLSAQARGQDHGPSRELASSIRALAIELHNQHSQTEAAQRITEMIHESFVELPRIAEVIKSDLAQLDALIGHREKPSEAPIEPANPPQPLLWSVLGTGTKLYGRSNKDPRDGSYITTLYLTVLSIPLLPISSYRVVRSGRGPLKFLSGVELSSTSRWHFGLVTAAVLFLLIRMMAPTASDDPPSERPTTPAATSPFADLISAQNAAPGDQNSGVSINAESGHYRGTVTNDGFRDSPASLDLDVSGEYDERSGYLRIGPPLGGSGPFLSLSSKDTLRLLTVSETGDTIAWAAGLNGASYRGQYFVVGGRFQGQHGVWDLAHISGLPISPGRSQRLSFQMAGLLSRGISQIAAHKSCIAAPTPTSGTEFRSAPRDGLGRLEIANGGTHDAYAVLVNGVTNRPFRAMLVRAGDEAAFTKVRPGTYRLRFLLGTGWTKGGKHFCQRVSASEFERVMEFEETQRSDGIEYSTYRISLQAVPGGTGKTHFIDLDSIN